ncbi:hypothetical protein BG005_003067, partial [Podila minutissima]
RGRELSSMDHGRGPGSDPRGRVQAQLCLCLPALHAPPRDRDARERARLPRDQPTPAPQDRVPGPQEMAYLQGGAL